MKRSKNHPTAQKLAKNKLLQLKSFNPSTAPKIFFNAFVIDFFNASSVMSERFKAKAKDETLNQVQGDNYSRG